MSSYSIQEINEVLQGEIVGFNSCKITAPEQLEAATETEISFIGSKRTNGIFVLFLISLSSCFAVASSKLSSMFTLDFFSRSLIFFLDEKKY